MQPYFQQLFWAGTITVAYLPSTVFPTGPSREGLPIGLQAVSAEYNDYICIDFARLVGEEMGGSCRRPGIDARELPFGCAAIETAESGDSRYWRSTSGRTAASRIYG
jgi:hypothetical protein